MGKKLIILDREYTVKSDLPSSYMEKIREYVESKFRELSDSHRPILEVAVLGALNITDELFQERELNRKNTDIARQIVEILEQVLSESQVGSLGCS